MQVSSLANLLLPPSAPVVSPSVPSSQCPWLHSVHFAVQRVSSPWPLWALSQNSTCISTCNLNCSLQSQLPAPGVFLNTHDVTAGTNSLFSCCHSCRYSHKAQCDVPCIFLKVVFWIVYTCGDNTVVALASYMSCFAQHCFRTGLSAASL